MTIGAITLSYDGGDATRNAIDAKLFGQSLQGLDRMVSDCLIIFSAQRLPKRGERAPMLLKAREPQAGSVTVPQLLQEASDLLGFGIPILQIIGPEIVGHYVSAVLDYFKGKDSSTVDLAISKMAEMHRDALAAMANSQAAGFEALADSQAAAFEALANAQAAALEAIAKSQAATLQTFNEVDQRRHEEAMGLQDLLRTSIRGSGAAAVDYVAPVGRSVDTATFVAGALPAIGTNKEDAEAIRESQKLEWMPPAREIVTTDGFKFHTSALSIENPDGSGFLMAEVNDPVFEEEANPYTVAAQKRAKVEVLARKGYKNGQLARVLILDFVREINDRAA